MSVFSESIYAQYEVNENRPIDVKALVDTELERLRRDAEEAEIVKINQDEKIELIKQITEAASEIAPKQINLLVENQKLQSFYQARDKYMDCLRMKNRNCSGLKRKFEEANPQQQSQNSESSQEMSTNYNVLNPYVLNKIKECSEVTREVFPDFQAVVEVNFTIDNEGKATAVYVNEKKSEISHDLHMFPKCIEHFAKNLYFENNAKKVVSFSKSFIL
jgi:hypothetical protein